MIFLEKILNKLYELHPTGPAEFLHLLKPNNPDVSRENKEVGGINLQLIQDALNNLGDNEPFSDKTGCWG